MNIGEDAYIVGKRFMVSSNLQLNAQTDEVDQI